MNFQPKEKGNSWWCSKDRESKDYRKDAAKRLRSWEKQKSGVMFKVQKNLIGITQYELDLMDEWNSALSTLSYLY